MNIAIEGINHVDPTGASAGSGLSQGQVYNSLMEYRGCFYEDTSPPFKPSLAKSWEFSPDGRTWTVHLRDDVKWQNLPPVNGRKFTADDVVWTANFHINQKTQYRSYFENVAMETPNDYTVVFKLKEPNPDFLYTCCIRPIWIVPHEVFERDGDFKSTAVGTGAWMVSDLRIDTQIVTRPNPEYYEMGLDGKPMPYMSEVRQPVLPDYAAVVAALRAGQIDNHWQGGMQAHDVPSLLQCCPKLRYRLQNRFTSPALYFNLQKPPWNDVRVRQAVRMAINREDLIVTFANYASHTGYMPPGFEQYSWPVEKRKELFKQDVPGALKLMQEAGYGLNKPINTVMKAGGTYQQQAEVVQQHLKAIGIDAKIDVHTVSPSSILPGGQQPVKDDTELAYGNLGQVFYPSYWMSDIIRTGSSQNYFHLNDPELDRLAAAQGKEMDPAKRKDLFFQIQDRMYNITPWVPTVVGHFHRFISCRMKNVPFMEEHFNSYAVVVGWIDETGC